jgi:phage/plasmid-associated DNA primase
MAAYLTSPRALSGALNRALEMLPIIRNEGIVPTESTLRAFEEFRETTDPLTVWLDRNTIVSPGASIPKDELVNAYNHECERQRRAVVTKTSFTKSLKRLRPMVTDGQPTINGVRVHVYNGLAWKSRRDDEY